MNFMENALYKCIIIIIIIIYDANWCNVSSRYYMKIIIFTFDANKVKSNQNQISLQLWTIYHFRQQRR